MCTLLIDAANRYKLRPPKGLPQLKKRIAYLCRNLLHPQDELRSIQVSWERNTVGNGCNKLGSFGESMKKTTRLEAPDGGWGILVCFGMAMPFICGLGAIPSFGLIFGDFLKGIGAGTSAIAVITSAFFSSFSFAGLFTSVLYKRYSLRSVGLLGGILYFIGSVLQIYVKSTVELLVAFSLIQGIAFGLMVPTSYTIFNNYFVKKRVMMMSFAQTLIGVGTMFYPVVVQQLNQAYGFRGCLMVLAAINSHAILGMMIMQPVEWHMKRVEINDDETSDRNSILKQPLEPLLEGTVTGSKTSLDLRLNKDLSSRAASIASLGNWTGAIVVSDASVEMQGHPKKTSCWQAIVDFLDLTLLKDPIYLNIVLGISFALYSDIAFFTLQPLYLFELDYNKADTANIIAIGAAADLLSRVFLAFGAIFVTVSSRHVYLAGAFFTIISRFAFLEVFDFTKMAIVTAIMGFLRTWIHVPLPLVFAEFLPRERFASGYGLFMFLQGNITFAIGPIVGYLRDTTKDYVLTFHCLNFFMGLCAIPWIIEVFYLRCRKEKKIEELELDGREMKNLPKE